MQPETLNTWAVAGVFFLLCCLTLTKLFVSLFLSPTVCRPTSGIPHRQGKKKKKIRWFEICMLFVCNNELVLHAAAYGAKTQETTRLEPASAPSSMQSLATDHQTWGETNNHSLETFVLSLLYLTGKKVDLSLLCLQRETPAVVTMCWPCVQ